jgi:hypothetical protein
VEQDLWYGLLPVAAQMDESARHRMVEVVEGMGDQALSGLARIATERGLWPSLLRMLADQDAAMQERIAAAWLMLDRSARNEIEQQVRELGLDQTLSPLREALGLPS